jgi:hypothetical protein
LHVFGQIPYDLKKILRRQPFVQLILHQNPRSR